MFQTRNMSLEVQLNIGNVLGNPPQCLSYDDTLFRPIPKLCFTN